MATTDADLTVTRGRDYEDVRRRIDEARQRLAELDTLRTTEAARVAAIQAKLFGQLRTLYHERDQLHALLQYRQRLLAALKARQESQTRQAEREYEATKDRIDEEYEEAARGLLETHEIPKEKAPELLRLWKKLVKLYHPDRFAHDPSLQATYHQLTSAINHARDTGDLDTLREIAADPEGFVKRRGWQALDFREEVALEDLERLYQSLKREIARAEEGLNNLRESSEYKLCEMVEGDPDLLDEVVTKRKAELETRCAELETHAEDVRRKIEDIQDKNVTDE